MTIGTIDSVAYAEIAVIGNIPVTNVGTIGIGSGAISPPAGSGGSDFTYGNDANTILDNIEGENKFGTAPTRDAYFALAHTDLTTNLDAMATFVSKAEYPAPMKALRSEWGTSGNLRFLVSSVGSSVASESDLGDTVYNVFCMGMEAYACVEQDGYSASFIYRPPIFDGPLALNCSVGYKFAEVPRITNDLWIINLRSTLS